MFIFWRILKIDKLTFQIINHLTTSAIPLKITFYNIKKKTKTIIMSRYSYFLFVNFFNLILKI